MALVDVDPMPGDYGIIERESRSIVGFEAVPAPSGEPWLLVRVDELKVTETYPAPDDPAWEHPGRTVTTHRGLLCAADARGAASCVDLVLGEEIELTPVAGPEQQLAWTSVLVLGESSVHLARTGDLPADLAAEETLAFALSFALPCGGACGAPGECCAMGEVCRAGRCAPLCTGTPCGPDVCCAAEAICDPRGCALQVGPDCAADSECAPGGVCAEGSCAALVAPLRRARTARRAVRPPAEVW